MEVHSITGDSAVISRQWVGELPSFGPSGKGAISLGWHGVVIKHEWISARHRCGQEASWFSTTALRRFPRSKRGGLP